MNPTNSEHRTIAEAFIDGRSTVGQPALSPHGDHVAFVVASTDLAANTTRSRIWLDDAPVSAGDHDANPTWSPDGRFLAFTSRRGEKQGDATLHVLPIGGPGELRTVCSMPDGLGDVAWSPDGRWIAFTSRSRHERYDAKDASWQAPRKIERFFSRLNGDDWIADRPQHVYVVAANGTGSPRNLTPGDFQHDGVAWLADSSGIITSAQRHDTWDLDLASDLYAVSLPGVGSSSDAAPGHIGEVRCLTAHDGEYGSPSISPDGSHVAFIGVSDPRTHSQNAHVGILPITADGATHREIRWLTGDLDRPFQPTNGFRAPVWESNRVLLAVAEDRGDTHLYRVTVDGSSPLTPITNGPLTVTGFDAAAGTVVTVRTTVDHPAELYVNEEQRTDVAASVASRSLGWEKFAAPTATTAASDGADDAGEIDAWIMRPADFDPAKRYPVLLNVHGGPHSQYGEYFHDEFQMQAAAGFVVVLGNPRGSSGRHTGWGQAIMGANHPTAPGSGWGTVDVDDVLAIIDAALDRYDFCDPDRVGMLGGSYGGYMATWLAGHHGERFRAFCSERAVNNATSMEWSSDIATAFTTVHGGTHLDLPDEYLRLSPMQAVRNIESPMLIIHSDEDWRCPINQAEELWVALKLLGKAVDFYRFPGENHELSRSGSPIHRVQRAEIILDWFAAKLARR
jgi:dipeptidyl aminopeptidase/acylaminoacyl peptidase